MTHVCDLRQVATGVPSRMLQGLIWIGFDLDRV
jgi:hypothetical protein